MNIYLESNDPFIDYKKVFSQFLQDDKVLSKLAVGEVAANELKYYAICHLVFRRHYDDANCKISNDTATKRLPIEEVLVMIDEDVSLVRTCFPSKEIHKEVCQRKKQLRDTSDINRTILNEIVFEMYPILKELGFKKEVLLVTIS